MCRDKPSPGWIASGMRGLLAILNQCDWRLRMKRPLKFHQALSFTRHAAPVNLFASHIEYQPFACPAVSISDTTHKMFSLYSK